MLAAPPAIPFGDGPPFPAWLAIFCRFLNISSGLDIVADSSSDLVDCGEEAVDAVVRNSEGTTERVLVHCDFALTLNFSTPLAQYQIQLQHRSSSSITTRAPTATGTQNIRLEAVLGVRGEAKPD
jgi:hypothetical protein